MSSFRLSALTLLAAVAGTVSQSAFATVPYTENFTTDAANWLDSTNANYATYVASGGIAGGGPDGSSYITSSKSAFGLTPNNFPVAFYGSDIADSSNDQFSGNWLASGINHFSTYVWHDAPEPLTFFVRFATANNFPGNIGQFLPPVAPGVWTKLDFDITPDNINSASNPNGQLLQEGPGSFNGAFSNVGNVQVGFFVTPTLSANPNAFHFALDQPSTSTPEPASWLLAMGSLAVVMLRRRKNIGT